MAAFTAARTLLTPWLLTPGAWLVKRGVRPTVDRTVRRDTSNFRSGWDWLQRHRALGSAFRLAPNP